MENSNDIIGNRSRNFPACSAVMFKVIGQQNMMRNAMPCVENRPQKTANLTDVLNGPPHSP
jgi:hypothetical protein